jgi:SAM-dependent methyltransferase
MSDDELGFDPGAVFDGVAGDYQSWRPNYPDALYDALETSAGPLAGRRVLDVGAGTGISARALRERRASVVAVDPSLSMARSLRTASAEMPTTLGRAEALPIGDGAVDLITCAQAWHWVRLPDAAIECRRVLRASGLVALWWNVSEDAGAFFDALESECGIGRYGGRERQDDDESLLEIGGFAEVRRSAVRWRWSVPLEHWMQSIQTRSVLAKLGPAALERLGPIEAVVRRFFPDGEVTEWFTTRLSVAVP